MLKNNKCPTLIFCRNCFISFLLVGLCSAIMADAYQSFQLSYQADNASEFSRLISLQMPK